MKGAISSFRLFSYRYFSGCHAYQNSFIFFLTAVPSSRTVFEHHRVRNKKDPDILTASPPAVGRNRRGVILLILDVSVCGADSPLQEGKFMRSHELVRWYRSKVARDLSRVVACGIALTPFRGQSRTHRGVSS
jgi:hypothetical protein